MTIHLILTNIAAPPTCEEVAQVDSVAQVPAHKHAHCSMKR